MTDRNPEPGKYAVLGNTRPAYAREAGPQIDNVELLFTMGRERKEFRILILARDTPPVLEVKAHDAKGAASWRGVHDRSFGESKITWDALLGRAVALLAGPSLSRTASSPGWVTIEIGHVL